jgi:hypothetical protein
MKLEAHPLVVAVALGLLGPGALVEDDEPEDSETSCSGCPNTDAVAEWEPGEAPDPDEFHRVEIEWLKLEGRG